MRIPPNSSQKIPFKTESKPANAESSDKSIPQHSTSTATLHPPGKTQTAAKKTAPTVPLQAPKAPAPRAEAARSAAHTQTSAASVAPFDATENSNLHLRLSRIPRHVLLQAVQHLYPDVAAPAQRQLADLLYDFGRAQRDTDEDAVIGEKLFTWVRGLQPGDTIGFPLTNAAYVKSKVDSLTETISKWHSHPKTLLDVGSGDGQLIDALCARLGADGTAIDVKMNHDWGRGKNEKARGAERVYYDGRNLADALPNKIFDVIMYNHSLHHFPSTQTQLRSLRDARSLLSNDGVLIITEHDSEMSVDLLQIIHALIGLRYEIDSGVVSNASEAVNHVRNYIADAGNATYHSESMWVHFVERSGFELVQKQLLTEDAARVRRYAFKIGPARSLLRRKSYAL